MSFYYIPYAGKKPAATSVNGHKLLILSDSREAVSHSLELFGADRVKRVKAGKTKEEEEVILAKIAKSVDAGLVIAPGEVGLGEIIRNLEIQLPWIQ